MIASTPCPATAGPHPAGRRVVPLVDAGSRARWLARLTWAAVAAGIALRLVRHLADRSLWLDESFLSLNVIGRPWSRLFGTLDFAQGAPPGFLALEKLSVVALGTSEAALRLPPLLLGCAALVPAAVAARRLLFSHVPAADDAGWRRIRAGVDRLGTRRGSWATDGAALLLYDFTRPASAP